MVKLRFLETSPLHSTSCSIISIGEFRNRQIHKSKHESEARILEDS